MREAEIGEADVQRALVTLLLESNSVREGLRAHCGAHLQLGLQGHALKHATRSVFEGRSETDVLADWVSESGHRLRMLIEVKLEANFMKLQGTRYRERVRTTMERGAADTALCMLVAPTAYFKSGNVELHQFDVKLPLEDLARWARADMRAEAALLDETLSRIAAGRTLGAKGLYHGIHDGLPRHFSASGSELRITNRATDWVFVAHPSLVKGVRGRYRISSAIAELRISRYFALSHDRLPTLLPANIGRVSAGSETLFRRRNLVVSADARKTVRLPAISKRARAHFQSSLNGGRSGPPRRNGACCCQPLSYVGVALASKRTRTASAIWRYRFLRPAPSSFSHGAWTTSRATTVFSSDGTP